MKKKPALVSASGALLAIALALLLAGRLSAGEEDAKAEKAIKALGGRVDRDDKAAGKPIIYVNFMKVTDAGLIRNLLVSRACKSLSSPTRR